MDMDPITRQEAEKIEGVLLDLCHDLELVSFLPDEFNLWMRDDVVSVVEKISPSLLGGDSSGNTNAYRHQGLTFQNHLDDEVEFQDEDDDDPAAREERQRLLKACCFVQAASAYGDAADSLHNEAILQVAEYNQTERNLLQTATSVGQVDATELSYYRLSLRALLDTLRGGGYAELMGGYLSRHYPPATVAGGGGGGNGRKKSNTNTTNNPNRTLDYVSTAFGGEDEDEGEGDAGAAQGLRVEDEEKVKWTANAIKHNAKYNPSAEMPYDTVTATQDGLVEDGTAHFAELARLLRLLMHLRNQTSVTEDVKRYRILNESINKERSSTADVQALNREYEMVRAARRREVSALDDAIVHLREEFDYVQRAADVELTAFDAATARIQKDKAGQYAQQLAQHQTTVARLQEKLQQVMGQHAEEVDKLRAALVKKVTAVESAIQEHDGQVEGLSAQSHKLRKEHEEDSEKLVAAEGQLFQLRQEEKEYHLEQQVEQQRQEHLDQIRQRMEQGARVLQAYYRAYAARESLVREAERQQNAKKKRKPSAKKSK